MRASPVGQRTFGFGLRQHAAGFEQLRTGRAMDRAIDAAAAEQTLIGGVDDRIDIVNFVMSVRTMSSVAAIASNYARSFERRLIAAHFTSFSQPFFSS